MLMLFHVSLVFWFKFMSLCPHCRVFSGVPTCAVCKTHFRVGSLLQGGKLNPYQEGAALGALRNCAGALADLVEVSGSGPFGTRALGDGEEDKAEVGRSPVPEKKESKEEDASQEKKKKASEEKKDSVSKKEKRKAKKKDKASKKKSPSREKEERSRETEKKEDRGQEEPLRATGSREPHPEERRREVSPDNRTREAETRGEEKRRRTDTGPPSEWEVRSDPGRYGSDQIPIRGTAGRHSRGEIIPAGRRAPPEPAGSPPRERARDTSHGDRRRYPGQGNPAKRTGRWKGYSHYNRGVDYWKNRGKRR